MPESQIYCSRSVRLILIFIISFVVMTSANSRKVTKKSKRQKLVEIFIAQSQAETLKNNRAIQKRKNELVGEVVSHLTQLNLIDSNTIDRGLDFYLISKVDRDLFSLPPRNNPRI